MLNPLRVLAAFLVVLAGTLGTATVAHPLEFDLSSVGPTIHWYEVATWNRAADAHRADIARRTAAYASAHPRVVPTGGGAVTGSCAAMKPAGFPDYIIQRESGGNPNAYNPSGARGCAQILGSHFASGGTCSGLDYASCWALLFKEQGLTPWACTKASGCG